MVFGRGETVVRRGARVMAKGETVGSAREGAEASVVAPPSTPQCTYCRSTAVARLARLAMLQRWQCEGCGREFDTPLSVAEIVASEAKPVAITLMPPVPIRTCAATAPRRRVSRPDVTRRHLAEQSGTPIPTPQLARVTKERPGWRSVRELRQRLEETRVPECR